MNPKEIVEKLNEKLKERKFEDAYLRQMIILFVLQEKSLSGEEAVGEYKKTKGSYKNDYYEYMDNLHSAFHYCSKKETETF